MIILHKGIRKDNGEEIRGFVTKMFGTYHIFLEDDENTAYEVEPSTIKPCLQSEIILEKGTSMSDAIEILFEYKSKGISVRCEFNGKYLYSDTIDNFDATLTQKDREQMVGVLN